MEHVDTVIVGGGQAGLATSYHLMQHGHEHVVLERAERAAPVWRNERWDSFTLVTPNWAFRLPGADGGGRAPDAFMPRDEVVAFFDRLVEENGLPVRVHTPVSSVEADGAGYRVRTPAGSIAAKNVVIATGFFQQPKIPAYSRDISPRIMQIHSSQYRNPESLPDGAVLVVGSAQSGCQIAEELARHGRRVLLSTGSAGRLPRRYRGQDIIAWLETVGLFDLTPEQLPPGMSKFEGIPQLSGTMGGHTINLHQFARDGITLLGHLRGAAGEIASFLPDLHENLTKVDGFEREALQMIDGSIRENGLDAPGEEVRQLRDGFAQPIVEEVDLRAAGINSVIWAMGYTFDYSLVKLPVFDGDGFPMQTRGVTGYGGLYFVGMPWMPAERSGFLLGVGEAAAHIAAQIHADTASSNRRAVTPSRAA
jgi:putative flavoprotein involved in K+ transport